MRVRVTLCVCGCICVHVYVYVCMCVLCATPRARGNELMACVGGLYCFIINRQ